MKKVNLTDFEGNVIDSFDLPEKPEEITFRQFVDFTVQLNKFATEMQDEVDPIKYLQNMVKVLSQFYQVDIEKFYEFDVSEIDPDNAVTMESSIVGMINYLQALIRVYKPSFRDDSNHQFTYKEKVFDIPFYRASTYLKKLTKRPDLKVGELVEAMEWDRFIDSLPDDSEGSKWFTSGLAHVAALAREKGEVLPEDPAEMTALVRERIEFFRDIPMTIAMDVSFFLSNTMKKLNKNRRSSISSHRRNRHNLQKKRGKLLVKQKK